MHQADLSHNNLVLKDKLDRIFQLRRTKTKINWDRAQYFDLLEAFGNPHKSLPPVIHVAGTNGKGSTIAILRAILQAQGLRVHTYTSPHLIHVNERINIAGTPIDDGLLEQLIDQALAYNKGAPLSFFEITTALAFRAFSDSPADVLLLEVGMGGRLDCTNVIAAPLATVINRISMDHIDFLGDDIRDIALEKAGVMKENVPCVIGCQGGGQSEISILNVIKNYADDVHAAPLFFGVDWDVVQQNERMIFSYLGKNYDFPIPSLLGGHQILNAGVALATLLSIAETLPVSMNAIERGLLDVQWCGRLQNIDAAPLGLAGAYDVWLDCGHNDSAGEALAQQVKLWIEQDAKPVHLIVGMLGGKDARGFLEPILPYLSGLHCVPISSDATSQKMDDFRHSIEILPVQSLTCMSHADVFSALRFMGQAIPSCRILIAGSVYLAGEVLSGIEDCD